MQIFRLLLFFFQYFVDPGGVFSGDRVNDGPDRQIAEDEDPCENQNLRDAPFQPAVDQIGGQVADV